MSARLARLIAASVAVGVLLQAVALLLLAGRAPVAHLELPGGGSWEGLQLVGFLLVLTFLADFVSVRVRRGDQVEELTLFEAAVVVVVLVLPAVEALLLPVLATVLVATVRRRGLVKILFNAGNLAAANALLVLIVHGIAAPGDELGWRTVVGLVLGALVFTGVNLVALSRVLAVVAGEDPRAVVIDGARLSAVMAVGTVAMGATAVTVASSAPALLPLTVMPAVALMFAYQAAAQESEERERSSRLLALSHVLAGRLDADEAVASFLSLARQAFGADIAVAVLDPGESPGGSTATVVVEDGLFGRERRPATAVEAALQRRGAATGAAVLSGDLPEGWERAVVAPLEADGRLMGVIALAVRERRSSLGSRELHLLTPLASALAVALRGAAHLQRLTEETSKLKAVVEQSSDGILVLDGAGTVLLWSPAVERLTGRAEAAALGRRLPALIATLGPDDAPVDPFLAGREHLTPSSPHTTVELVLRRDDGEDRVIRCAHAGVFDEDGLLVRVVVIAHDVTRERQLERLKADFIATVSHELRTPVTPIKGYADLLRRRGGQMTPEKRAECLDVISDRADHLARLVEDLLLASRISATKGTAAAQVEIGRDDLAQLVRRACGDFGTDGDRVGVDLPDGRVDVVCDPVRVVQVLTNLISNALKYSAPGTPVTVRLRSDPGGRAVVEVSDVGRGIPADQLERVFDKFHRVEDPMRMTTGGTGLGLYIARELATAMGGELSCSSVLGAGSTFTFTLPLAPSREAGAGTAVPADGEALPAPRPAVPWVDAPPRAARAAGERAPRPLG